MKAMKTMKGLSERERWELCYSLLPKVSRTFALSILGLREPLKGSVCVSYLLCRILDTIEDAPDLPLEDRADLTYGFLDALGARLPPPESWLSAAKKALAGHSSAADHALVSASSEVCRALCACPESHILAISRWVSEMGRGMVESCALMERNGGLRTLPTLRSLDRYCYYIAGTVGYLLTDLFFLESKEIGPELYFRLQRDAEDFGLGLQKVNILKDFRDDLARGWCFVPLECLEKEGLAPADMANGSKGERVRAALEPVLASAASHLARGWRYLEAVPVKEREIRLFLAYSLFFAVKTLALAVSEPGRLVSEKKLKISRLDVASIMADCSVKVGRPAAFSASFESLFAPLNSRERPARPV